jgi:transposase
MEIARQLGLARNTVRRFVRVSDPEELLGREGTGRRPTAVGPFEPYLRQRFTEGCRKATVLWTELKQRGYRGSYASVRDAVRPWRFKLPLSSPPPQPPGVRQVTAWIMSHPDHLDENQRTGLIRVLADCPELELLSGFVQDFATIMTRREGHRLDEWMERAAQTPIPELGSFVTGLRRDRDAAIAGLSLPYSSGVVEGHVNRLKMLKRQMYGRAKPDLLRKRVLAD